MDCGGDRTFTDTSKFQSSTWETHLDFIEKTVESAGGVGSSLEAESPVDASPVVQKSGFRLKRPQVQPDAQHHGLPGKRPAPMLSPA
jgi:hypothetical protein